MYYINVCFSPYDIINDDQDTIPDLLKRLQEGMKLKLTYAPEHLDPLCLDNEYVRVVLECTEEFMGYLKGDSVFLIFLISKCIVTRRKQHSFLKTRLINMFIIFKNILVPMISSMNISNKERGCWHGNSSDM